MPSVSFVRTAPASLGEHTVPEGPICHACGVSTIDNDGAGSYRHALSLDSLLMRHPASTYFVEVGAGDCESGVMHNDFLGVGLGDILSVDRSVVPKLGQLVLSVRDGVFVLGRYTEHDGKRFLVAENGTRSSYRLEEGDHSLWGVVTAIVKRL